MVDRCAICGCIVPEGTMVCKSCMAAAVNETLHPGESGYKGYIKCEIHDAASWETRPPYNFPVLIYADCYWAEGFLLCTGEWKRTRDGAIVRPEFWAFLPGTAL